MEGEKDVKPPETPSHVKVTRADGTLAASWPAVRGATSYHITYSSDSGASWSLAALNHPDASITIRGVENAKTYVVGVRARNDAGDSGWRNSDPAGPFTPPKPTPTPTPIDTTTPGTTTPPISTTTPPVDTTTSALTFGDATIADQSYTKDTPITALTLPKASRVSDGASATVGVITYSLSPALPAGLSFDANTWTISGTPTAASAKTAYTYTATDGTNSVSLSFSIEVTEGMATGQDVSAQAGLSWVTTPQHQNWQQGVAVDVTMPEATGANHHRLFARECRPKHQAGLAPRTVLERFHPQNHRHAHRRLQQAGIRVQRRGHQQRHTLKPQIPGGGHQRKLPAVQKHQEQSHPATGAALVPLPHQPRHELLQRLHNLRPKQRPQRPLRGRRRRHDDLLGFDVDHGRRLHQFLQQLRRGDSQASAQGLVLSYLHGNRPQRPQRLDPIGDTELQLRRLDEHY